jgi:DNA-binding transcriptional MerR regulator
MQYHTTDVSKACNVTLNTVRNWCKDYGQFLSDDATVTTGQRSFTGRDLEVFKYIALLRSEGMQKGAIVQRLGETTFADIDSGANSIEANPSPGDHSSTVDATLQAHRNELMAPDGAPALIVVVDDLQKRMALLEASTKEDRHNQRDGVMMFGLGFIAALMFVLLIIGLAVLYGGFR